MSYIYSGIGFLFFREMKVFSIFDKYRGLNDKRFFYVKKIIIWYICSLFRDDMDIIEDLDYVVIHVN